MPMVVAPEFLAARPELDRSKKYVLLIISGPEAGKVLNIEKTLVTIGRSGCDFIVDDPELSRRHAKVEVNGSSATLHDLGSTNGTFVDEERITTRPLDNRGKFRVGSHEIAFVVTDRDE